MKHPSTLLCLLLLACLPQIASAGELQVARADVIQPDTELQATVAEFRSLAALGSKEQIGKVEAFFAPKVKAFTRGLDPFQPWNPLDDIEGDYLERAASMMLEQGEAEAGLPAPDYRLEAMKTIAGLVAEGAAFGALPEMPGAVCAPAGYKVDRKAAQAFARKFELNASSLRFYAEDIVLVRKPKEEKGRVVSANTLIMFDYDPKAPDGWGYYETAGGIRGYMRDREDTLGLSQNHVCFSKVRGKYRITAIFGYGL